MNARFTFARCRIEGFLSTIRHFASSRPDALPRRSGDDPGDPHSKSRGINSDSYVVSKDSFVQEELGLRSSECHAGLYFFFDSDNAKHPFFYIGKAANLYERLTKHFLTFDYFFYASAFPKNVKEYHDDCLRFYAEGKYENKRALYERQFAAYDASPFKEIGWVSSPELADGELLKTVEDHAIFYYCPLANGTKGSAIGTPHSKKLFENIQDIVDAWRTQGAR